MNITELEKQAINALRFLSADAVQNANSGHPGLPMGAAALAYTIWSRHLRFNPHHPDWPARDRFILSGGHGSMLLYSLLHLTGYELSLEDLQQFRQWESLTPGHPEYKMTPGVEVTTGPLGQGFANGVGMAIAAEHLGAVFQRPGYDLFPQMIYALVTDGDLMEGVASEAASLAGHLRLGRLLYLYDDNRVSIDGSTDLAFTEDRLQRFRAYGWYTDYVEDGNDVSAIDAAIQRAKTDPRPKIIAVRTVIGYGLPTRQGTEKAHGEPPGNEELDGAKRALGWPEQPRFLIPEGVRAHFQEIGSRGEQLEAEWQQMVVNYRIEFPEQSAELERRLRGELPVGWADGLPDFPADLKGYATRNASGIVLNALAARIPELMGGSADLAPSNKTWLEGAPVFQAGNARGRNFHFGVREHAMGAIINGMAVHGGVIPYGGTFLVFSDYMRPAVRLSALSHYPSIWIFTHDSIGLGEDGPTHQPVEHFAALRAIPDLVTIRPADANEVTEAWKAAIARRDGPTALILSRQNMPTLDRERLGPVTGLQRGAYVLADLGPGAPEWILMASGSEVGLIVAAGEKLAEQGVPVRLVSFPSWELFKAQSKEYQQAVLLPGVKRRLAIEAGVGLGWERWVGDQGIIISLERFGASAPYQVLFRQFGYTVDRILSEVKNWHAG